MAGGDVGMVPRGQRVADVVQQRADDILLVAAVLLGEGGGLEGMRQAVDGEPTEIAVQQGEVAEDAVGKLPGEPAEVVGDDVPIAGSARLHRRKCGAGFFGK